jgi:hypothetical protein
LTRSLEAAANVPNAEEASAVAGITKVCLEGVRVGLAAMDSEYPSGVPVGRSKASRLGELIGRRVGRAIQDRLKPNDE